MECIVFNSSGNYSPVVGSVAHISGAEFRSMSNCCLGGGHLKGKTESPSANPQIVSYISIQWVFTLDKILSRSGLVWHAENERRCCSSFCAVQAWAR